MSKVCSKYTPARWVFESIGESMAFRLMGVGVRPFPRATGNWRWLLVAIDYFKKWVEVEPLANIRD